ncbi:MAG: S8 family serine peptidase, partial [Candidatus Cloacimonadaceae bacterium]|nr:S8 family serine peptidase [Candidatus Cloacimonadaceae bacterium]
MKKVLALMALVLFISSMLANGVEGNVLFKGDVLITVTGYSSGVVVTDKNWFNAIADEYQIGVLDTLFTIPSGDYEGFYYLAEFEKAFELEDIIEDLVKESSVEYAEPNHIMELLGINTNDTYASTSWGLEMIGMNQVWANQLAYGGRVKVAVLDSGIDLGLNPYGIHPDLQDNLWDDSNGVHGYNVLGYLGHPDEDIDIPQDDVGHGTHVAGIIGASTNNSIGVAGVAGGWGFTDHGCTVMPVRIGNYHTSVDNAILGIRWAVANGAEVLNMSWGWEGVNLTLRNWIRFIMGLNPTIVFVAAAGNNGSSVSCSPANIQGVISVGASGPNDEKAQYSNYGSLDLCAPGGVGNVGDTTAMISTTPQDDEFLFHFPPASWNSNYEYASGTSMAAPVVSGAVALLKEQFVGITRDQIIQRLQGTSDDLTQMNSNPIFMNSLGTGRLNVFRALTEDPHPAYRLNAITVEDGNDGILSTGEGQVDLRITLKNWWLNGVDHIRGFLSTDDPYITIDSDEGLWDSIDYLDTAISSGFVISDSSTYPRNIRFALTLTYEDIDETVYFELPCYPNIISLFDSAEYQVTSEIAIFDMDDDGIDELAFGVKKPSFGGFLYYACLYKNNQLLMAAVNDSIEASPAFGDLIYGGGKEVVFVTNQVTVYAFDSTLSSV